MTTFGEWLKKTREDKGLTQDDLAKLAGCSKSYISALENNKNNSAKRENPHIGLDVITKMAGALEVSSDQPRMIMGFMPEGIDTNNPMMIGFSTQDQMKIVSPDGSVIDIPETIRHLEEVAEQLNATSITIRSMARSLQRMAS